MNAVATERAARGAALLDERKPGWATEIDLDTLLLRDCAKCVLGQLYHGFIQGAEELFSEDAGEESDEDAWLDTACVYGFDRTSAERDILSFNDLQKAWVAEINKRREKKTEATKQ